MPRSPRTARQDASPVEDTSLAVLLAGSVLPADAGAELRPVADVLTALAARPARDELTGLAAAQAEFRRCVAVPAQARKSARWRPAGLASRLGARVGAAVAVVVMGLGGAAAAAYAGALPISWQQFAHRTIGAPPDGAGLDTRAATGAAGSAARRYPHPAYQAHSGGPATAYGSRHHTAPAHYAGPPTVSPFVRRSVPPALPEVARQLPPSRNALQWPTPTEPIVGRSASVSNAGSVPGVS